MAGRVLRDSKGRYKGSTKGWGAGLQRGRAAIRSAKLPVAGVRTRAAIASGLSAGVLMGTSYGAKRLILGGSRSGNMKMIAAGGALNVVGRFAMASAVVNGGIAVSRKKLAS